MSPRACTCQDAALEPLTWQQIDRRIANLVTEVSAPTEAEGASGGGNRGFRWIAAADLVQRMRPHLVLN
jgi:hypothetical protein